MSEQENAIVEQLTPMIEDVSSQIDALVVYANETTGNSDTSIGDAVKALVEGYGKGGVSLEPYMEVDDEFTLDEDFTSTTYTTVHDVLETDDAKINTVIDHDGNSMLITTMKSTAYDFTWFTISVSHKNSSGKLFNVNLQSFKDSDGCVFQNSSAFGVSPYMQYGRLVRVSGKCSTSTPSVLAGTYTINMKAYDLLF